MRYVDGLTNPKVYHRPPKRVRPVLDIRKIKWKRIAAIILIGALLSYFAGPRLTSLARQVQLATVLTNGRYLVLFQNDAEVRASGGFIGSFAVIQARSGTIKPLYFETNIYKLDDPFALQVKITPPGPLHEAIGERGWALRDSNFAADFRQSAPTAEWFFEQEAKHTTGPRQVELDKALNGNYRVDGVIAVNMSAFFDVLDATGPIMIPGDNVTVNKDNFFPIVQQVVEMDYFKDAANAVKNEPKTILQNLFPVAIKKVEGLPKTTQYRLLTTLLHTKKIVIYSHDEKAESDLVSEGWAGAIPAIQKPSDFLAVIRSSHGANKSSLDINPIYTYSVDTKDNKTAIVKLAIVLEHTGNGEWPSGVSREYLRVLTAKQATLISALHNGQTVTEKIDIGVEADKAAFGFWLNTQPQSSQTMTLTYEIPLAAIQKGKYQLALFRQPGGNSADLTVNYNGNELYQGRLTGDRVIEN